MADGQKKDLHKSVVGNGDWLVGSRKWAVINAHFVEGF